MISIRIFFALFIVSLILTGQSNAQDLQKYEELLNESHMQFSIPPDFMLTPVIKNGDVMYDFAIKSNTQKFEIRYRIWPIEKGSAKDKMNNSMHNLMLTTMALNISNGQIIEPQQYPKESVKEEFGADAGSTGIVDTHSEFGKDYKACMISVIHKENVADAYIFFLFNDRSDILKALSTSKIFHALKFK